ncbi:MAG: 50S ribosomal protein L6 [Candidatus Hodarchaeales archaeon]
MPQFVVEEKTIHIPAEVQLELNEKAVTVKGPKGELSRGFDRLPVYIDYNKDEGHVAIRSFFGRQFERAIVGTVAGHIENMIVGVTKAFEYKLKIISSHFPMTVKRTGDQIEVKNHYGERAAKYAKIVGNTQMKVVGDDVILTGIDKEALGQTAANLQEITRLRGKRRKDPTTFMDGIYLFERS